MKSKVIFIGLATLAVMLLPYAISNHKDPVEASSEPLATCRVLSQQARVYEDPEFPFRYLGSKVYSCEGDFLKVGGTVNSQPARLLVAPVVVVHYVGARMKVFLPVELYDGTRGLVDGSQLRPLDDDRA